jgi:RNA polymerase sigma-70 factor (ECF subfamily)
MPGQKGGFVIMEASLQALSDQELAVQSQAGSLAAFEQLVYRYEARVLGFLGRCCHDEQVAREVTQDTFVRAFHALAKYEATKPFAPWLFTIARRKCIDHYRAFPLLADAQAPESPHYDDPAELLARDESRLQLWRIAREHLTKNQVQALWLRYVEDFELEQIAQVMRKTRTGVKVLLFRARQTLGRFLGGKDAWPSAAAVLAKLAQPSAPVNPRKTSTDVSLRASQPGLILKHRTL